MSKPHIDSTVDHEPDLGTVESFRLDRAANQPAAEASIQRVGRYEIQALLGQGGMGIAYRTWDPQLKRVVALKMIKGGQFVSPDDLARFRLEAAAIAQVRHPHIVQIYDVGDHQGQPFFAMEFCAGGSLAERLKKQPLPARTAAVLVEQIARGVAAAHEQKIIHRDLKPANVLLAEAPPEARTDSTARGAGESTRQPGRAPAEKADSSSRQGVVPVCKVTDFGLAKHLDSDDGQTRTGAIMGTPSYMAPEQAFGQTRDLQPTADVYALGAILYECRDGGPPFRGATMAETLDQVRNQDPLPPSRLQPKLPRDLEIICLKCLAKEPRKRYQSAAACAEDLGRYLSGEPIQARATPLWERTWKWIKRRPVLTTALALVLVATVGLLAVWVGFTVALREQTDKALQNERSANQNRLRAEANRDKMIDAVDRLLTRVGDKKLKGIPGFEELSREVLTDAQAIFTDLLAGADDPDPVLRREAGRALWRSAKIHSLLNQVEKQGADLRQAEALQRRLMKEFPDEPTHRGDLGRTLHSLGLWTRNQSPDKNRLDQSIRILEEALELRQALGRGGPPEAQADWARTLQVLGNAHKGKGDPALADKHFLQALDMLEPLSAAHADPKYRQEWVAAHINPSALYLQQGRYPEAEKILLKAASAAESSLAETPNDFEMLETLSTLYQNQGVLAFFTKRPEWAREVGDKHVKIRERLAATYRGLPRFRYDVAVAYRDLSIVAAVGLAPDKYLPIQKELGTKAVAVLRELHAEFPKDEKYRLELARSCGFLGQAYGELRQTDEGVKLCQEALDLAERLVQDHPNDKRFLVTQGVLMTGLADVYRCGQRRADAVAWAERGAAILQRILTMDPGNDEATRFLGLAQSILKP